LKHRRRKGIYMLRLYIVRRQAARSTRLHIAEFPKQFMLFEGFLRIAAAVTEVGR